MFNVVVRGINIQFGMYLVEIIPYDFYDMKESTIFAIFICNGFMKYKRSSTASIKHTNIDNDIIQRYIVLQRSRFVNYE